MMTDVCARRERLPARETAIFAGGCFWCLEAVFNEVEGVLSVKSGYIGGYTANPDYRSVCVGDTGHAEAVRVVFDPSRISYRDLLEIFFAAHDPTTLNRQGNDVGTQYRSAVFVATTAQRDEALTFIDDLNAEQLFHAVIVTQVETAGRFWPAENCHDNYFAQHREEPYCQFVIQPKLGKFRVRFANRRKHIA